MKFTIKHGHLWIDIWEEDKYSTLCNLLDYMGFKWSQVGESMGYSSWDLGKY